MNRISTPADLKKVGFFELLAACQSVLKTIKSDHQRHLELYNGHLRSNTRSEAFMQTFKKNLVRDERHIDYVSTLIKRLQSKHYQKVLGTLIESIRHAKEHAGLRGIIQYPYGFFYLVKEGEASTGIFLHKSELFQL